MLLLLFPLGATAFEGSVSAELAGGNRTLSANLLADWGMVPDTLYLVANYGFVKHANVQVDPALPSQPLAATHLFGLGVDFSPSMHWLTSLMFNFSPKATDSFTFGERLLSGTASSSRRSVQGIAALAYQSAGLSDLEWGLDGTFIGAWYELSSRLVIGRMDVTQTTNLFLGKPSLGLTLTFFGKTDVMLRGTYSVYSTDPVMAGKPQAPRLDALIDRFGIGELAAARLGQFDAISGYNTAPSWVEGRVSVLHRFTPRLSGQLAYTFVRYVVGQGYAHVFSSRWSWRPKGFFRVWLGGSVQYDEPRDDPSKASEATPGWSGYASLGAELSTE